MNTINKEIDKLIFPGKKMFQSYFHKYDDQITYIYVPLFRFVDGLFNLKDHLHSYHYNLLYDIFHYDNWSDFVRNIK